jgi:hypothetical protein
MQQRLNVKITFDITTPDGQPWHKTEITYSDMPIENVIGLEKVGIEALATLANIGAPSAGNSGKKG